MIIISTLQMKILKLRELHHEDQVTWLIMMELELEPRQLGPQPTLLNPVNMFSFQKQDLKANP